MFGSTEPEGVSATRPQGLAAGVIMPWSPASTGLRIAFAGRAPWKPLHACCQQPQKLARSEAAELP